MDLEITGCHPHDTQELAYFTSGLVAEQAVATPELVDRALDMVLRAENAQHTEVWSQTVRHQHHPYSATR